MPAVDLCVADFLFAAVNVPIGGTAPVVLFEHNVEYHDLAAAVRAGASPVDAVALFEIEWRKLRAREADACRRADLTIAVSEDDRRRLEQLAPGIRAASIPTGVDTDYFTPMPARRAAGAPGVQRIDGLASERGRRHLLRSSRSCRASAREIPETTFTVVGRNPTARLRDVAERAGGIIVTGTVDDVRPSIAEGAVYVVPLRAGGGTRLKIFEALAMGKTGGLDHGRRRGARHRTRAPLHRAPTTRARLPTPSCRCCATRSAGAELGGAGRHLVETCYSWPTIARAFEERCEEVVAGHVMHQRETPTVVLICHEEESPRPRRARVVAGEHNEIGWSLIIRDEPGVAGAPSRREIRRASGCWGSSTSSPSAPTRGVRPGTARRCAGRTRQVARLRARYPASLDACRS